MAFSLEDIQESLQNFDPEQLNDIDAVGSWPLAVKIIIWLIFFMGVLALGYFLFINNEQAELAKVQTAEQNLRADYENKYFQAVHLEAFRKQQIEMEESFQAIIRQLPADTEIPGLIEDITLVGLENGLTFTSIDLQAEVRHEFYIEKPIKIIVNGSYHDLGSFVSDVADLSRIVTLHDFTIVPARSVTRGQDSGGLLRMEILAKTYRYNDEPE